MTRGQKTCRQIARALGLDSVENGLRVRRKPAPEFLYDCDNVAIEILQL